MDQVKVCWVSIPTEAEKDVLSSCLRAGIECTMFAYGEGNCSIQKDLSGWVPIGARTPEELISEAVGTKPDLLVLRYPVWCSDQVASIMRSLRSVAFLSEQGPSRCHAAVAASRFDVLGVGSATDLDFYRYRFPNKKVILLPFGCFASEEESGTPKIDIICASTPHYACYGKPCGGDDDPTAKRESVDVLVKPLVGRDLHIWGPQPWESDCGWNRIEWATTHYRGWRDDVEKVERESRISLGITWNWRMGGYGMKLAKLLGHGGPAVLWHRTQGMDRDGLVEGEHLVCSGSQEETVALTDKLLSDEPHRKRLARAGWEFARENLEWAVILRRTVEQLG